MCEKDAKERVIRENKESCFSLNQAGFYGVNLTANSNPYYHNMDTYNATIVTQGTHADLELDMTKGTFTITYQGKTITTTKLSSKALYPFIDLLNHGSIAEL